MISRIGAALLFLSLTGCSETTTFEIRNDSHNPIMDVTVWKSGTPTMFGEFEPGEARTIEFRAVFENSYRLTYEQNGQKFHKDLCYQAWGYKANGTISIRSDDLQLKCQ